MHFYKDKKRHVITTQTKHKCMLDSCSYLQQEGFEVTYLPVKPDKLVDLEKLRASIRPDTGLVSVMMVINEIVVIQLVEEIGKICKEFKVPLHTDAVQALGKIPIDADKMNISLTEALDEWWWTRYGDKELDDSNAPTVGFGAACELAMKEMEYDDKRIRAMHGRLLNGIREKIDGIVVNRSEVNQYSRNLNLSLAFVEGGSLLMGLKEVAVSSGSACTSASLEPSYVLRALGVDEDMAHTSIKYGIGRFTTKEDIDRAVELTVKHTIEISMWDVEFSDEHM
ncbi:unnamed protein product [Fraxinus pennsylvanica]|uniref:Aminotransferase class V domain-containing protein n=1 Tax=Fraxinus pennsylvanica TaxID=56036 RepID=A0AAD1YKI8_9LAMI|nr:unnamed protein product [Fraxinus pennsylvanica]